MNAQWTDRIAAVVYPDQVCRLALDLCDIASPTGEEDALSAFIVMRPTLREPLSIIIEWLPSLPWLVIVRRNRRFALALAALVLISTDCATVLVTGRSQLVLISDDEMAALADEPAARLQNYFRQSGRILSASESPDAEGMIALVNKVCNRLLDVSGLARRFQWEITVVKASEVNANVTPNGKITVFTGLT